LLEFIKVSLRSTPTGDGHQDVTGLNATAMIANDLSHLAAQAVSHHSTAQLFSSHQAESKVAQRLITKKGQHKVPARLASAPRPDCREVAGLLHSKAGRQAHEQEKTPRSTDSGVLLNVALEVDLHALWNQTLATSATATAQDVTTVFGLHASAEAKLLFAGALRRLIGSLGHKCEGWSVSAIPDAEPDGGKPL
jgi:hypothetical protein